MLKGLSDGSFFLSLDWLDHSLKSRLDDSLSLSILSTFCVSPYTYSGVLSSISWLPIVEGQYKSWLSML